MEKSRIENLVCHGLLQNTNHELRLSLANLLDNSIHLVAQGLDLLVPLRQYFAG